MQTLNFVDKETFHVFFEAHNIPLQGTLNPGIQPLSALLAEARRLSYILWLFISNVLLDPLLGGLSTNFVDKEEAYAMYRNFVQGVINQAKNKTL